MDSVGQGSVGQDWDRLEEALRSERWDFRSIEGIAGEIGLPQNHVRCLLEQNEDKIRTTLSRDRRVVYALRSKPVTIGELWDRFVILASR